MEDGYQRFFSTLAEAIVFATLLVSFGKYCSDYYLFIFLGIIAFVIASYESYKYIIKRRENEKLSKIIRNYSHPTFRTGNNRRNEVKFEQGKDGKHNNNERKRSFTFSDNIKIKSKMKSPMKSASTLSSLRNSINRKNGQKTKVVIQNNQKVLKRPKSLTNILKGKDLYKSTPNVTLISALNPMEITNFHI